MPSSHVSIYIHTGRLADWSATPHGAIRPFETSTFPGQSLPVSLATSSLPFHGTSRPTSFLRDLVLQLFLPGAWAHVITGHVATSCSRTRDCVPDGLSVPLFVIHAQHSCKLVTRICPEPVLLPGLP